MYRIEEIVSTMSRLEDSLIKVERKGEALEKRIRHWFLILAVVPFLISLVLVVVHHFNPLSSIFKSIGLYMALVSQVFGVLLLFSESIIGIISIIRWKTYLSKYFTLEIERDEEYAKSLFKYEKHELLYAKYWIETKVSRNESRLKLFFGDKTAAIALLGLSWPVIKAFGGLEWLSKSISHFMMPGNLPDTVLLVFLALLLGMSLGGLVIKNINERYKYQISLIELTVKLKELAKK